jgi:hypothetical protein
MSFSEDTEGFNDLVVYHEAFKTIDPANRKPHSAEKLLSMWKEVNSKYKISLANFTQSGTHESDFWSNSNGRADVLYLRKWLEVRPNGNTFAQECFPDEDEFDTLVTPKRKKQRKGGNGEDYLLEVADAIRSMTSSQEKRNELRVKDVYLDKKLELEKEKRLEEKMMHVQAMYDSVVASVYQLKDRIEKCKKDGMDFKDEAEDLKFYNERKRSLKEILETALQGNKQ